jgi:hypothetical protein
MGNEEDEVGMEEPPAVESVEVGYRLVLSARRALAARAETLSRDAESGVARTLVASVACCPDKSA